MDPSLALSLAHWTWVVLSTLALICAATLIWAFVVEGDEWFVVALALLCMVASIGFLYFSVSAVGGLTVAKWIWLIANGIALGGGLLCCVAARIQRADVAQILSVLGATVLAGFTFITSIFATTGPVTRSHEALSAAAPVTSGVVFLSQISIWHNVTLTVLGVGILVFLILFIADVGRGISPGVESHWDGLGGGVGGWQMSSSLTYFLGVLIFGVLFSVLVLREENAVASQTSSPAADAITTSKREGKATPQPAPSQAGAVPAVSNPATDPPGAVK
jgi:hypothetical protein